MSNHLAIATVTGTLRYLIERALAPEPSPHVSTVRPDNSSQLPTFGANVFLYNAQPDQALNVENLPLRNSAGDLVNRPRVAMELHYLITFYGDETKLEPQRLLARVAATLHGRGVLTRPMIQNVLDNAAFNFLAGSDLNQDVELVKISPQTLSLEEMSKLWSILLQTKYALAITYKATAVYVEEPDEVVDVLPVRDRQLFGVVFSPPVVERVAPLTLPYAPNSALTIYGQNLGGDGVMVRFGTETVQPSFVSDTKIVAVPPRSAQAGATTVTIIKPTAVGSRFTMDSDPAAFVLQPRVTSQSAAAGVITVGVEPIVGERQQAEVVLFSLPSAAAPLEFAIPAAARPGPAASVTASVGAIPTGTYMVRVRVDGAASALTVDQTPGSPTFGQFNGPTVVI
jgi:hypothetical protein